MCDYEREQARLAALIDDIPSDNEEYFGGDISESDDEDNEIVSDHESETDQEGLDYESDDVHDSGNNFTGKDGSL